MRSPDMWQSQEGSETILAELYPVVLQSYLSTSVSVDREAPLYIGEPTSYIQETTLKMPEAWTVSDQKQEINSVGFTYKSEMASESDRLIKLNYEYHIQQSSVPVEDIAEFVAAQKEIENTMVFSLTYNGALAGFRFSWVSFIIFLAGMVVSVMIARHFYLSYDPQPEYSGEARSPGGWLLLFVVGAALSPLLISYDLFVNNSQIFNHGMWTSLLGGGEGVYNLELAVLIIFETLYNGFIIVFSILMLVLLIQRRSSAPRMAIAYMVISLVMQFIDTVMATALVEDAFTQAQIRGYYGDVFRTFISTCIWVPYLLLSDRVKETFVKRADEKKEALSGTGALAESKI